MEKKRFGVIDGGKQDSLSAADRNKSIRADIERQNDLTAEEKRDLVERMKNERVQSIRAAVARFNGIILGDEEARVLHDRLPALVLGNTQVETELREQFPQLHAWFDQLKK